MNRDSLAILLVIAITFIWIAAVVGGIYRRDWTALNIITPVMVTACGWLYLKRNGKDG